MSKQTPQPMLSNRLIFWITAIVLFFGFLFIIRDMLLPFILGIMIAYFLDPAADKLEKWGCGRALATTVITALFFALIAVFILTLSPILIKQVIGLIADIPNYIATLRGILLEQVEKLPIEIDIENGFDTEAIFGQFATDGKAIALRVVKSGMAIINLISLLVITPVVAFYLLRDWDKLVTKIDNLLPRKTC